MNSLLEIKGIGKKTLEALEKENISTVHDVLYHFPEEYIIYEENKNYFDTDLKSLIKGNVISSPYFIKMPSGVNAIIFYINAYGYKLKCLYFGMDYLRFKLHEGNEISLYGRYNKMKKEFHIEKIFFEYISDSVDVNYNLKGIQNKNYQNIIKEIFKSNIRLEETLPTELLSKYKLLTLDRYLYLSHFPVTKNDIKEVMRRRKYEEMFWYSLRLRMLKENILRTKKEKRVLNNDYHDRFLSMLPFDLTSDQLTAINDCRNDILNNVVMNRLIQGDVGCGKTIVAFYSAIFEVSCGMQAIILAPTQVLAQQHFKGLSEYSKKLGIRIALMTSDLKKSEYDDILQRLKLGSIDILIGTHSVLNDKLKFKNLGLLVIDEQHKFGVEQRSKILKKYEGADALYMSATPIPRTLGLTSFGDLDITSIKTMPIGRSEIETKIIPYKKLGGVLGFIKKEKELKHQCYVVCPLIQGNDDIKHHTVMDAKRYIDEIDGIRSQIITGKMKAKEKDDIMLRFRNGEIDCLIATTVIEVGIDNKNATTIVIFDASMFGLAVLHQLRGRVGRGNLKGYCCLMSDEADNVRLNALVNYKDGFSISEIDFKERGAGDFFGHVQSGFVNLEYSSIIDDGNIWECAKNDANNILKSFIDGSIKSSLYDEIVLLNNQQNGKIN